jgi:hypothetical protein
MKANQSHHRLRKLAYQTTLKGLRDKVPIFLIAVVAWISLSVLDRSKSNYQAARNIPIEVNDEFVKATKAGVWTRHLNDPYRVKYRKYGNQRDLLDALAASAMADNAMRQAKLESATRDLWDKWEREKTRLQVENNKALEKANEIKKEEEKLANNSSETNKAGQIKKIDQELKTIDDARQKNSDSILEGEAKYKANAEMNAGIVQTLFEDSREKIDSIYKDLGASLPGIILATQQKPRGSFDSLFESLLKPVLDEQSSLYVIFQTLRLTALILLVLSFVFVLVMALRQLPLASGADTLTDQIKSLISFKPGGGGQDMARAAIVSVAALGVGTAAVIAGTSINDKANRALEMASASAVSPGPGSSLLAPGYYPGSNVLRLSPSTNLNTNSLANYIANSATYNDGEIHLPDFKPVNNITVPDPVVRIIGVPDRAGTRALIAQINAVGSKLPLADFAALKTSVAQAQQDLAAIKIGLGGFKNETTTANANLSNIYGSLTQLSTERLAAAAAQTRLMTAANSKLDDINKSIESQHQLDTVWPPRSDGRNLASRASQFFGSERFAASEKSVQVIKDHLPKSAEYDPIRSALDEIKYRLPASKQTFLMTLRRATGAHAPNATAAALEKLRAWETVILSYTRLPR